MKQDTHPFIKNAPDAVLSHQLEFEMINMQSMINNISGVMWSIDRKYNLVTSNIAFDVMVENMSGKKIEKGQCVFANGFTEEDLKNFKGYYDRAFAGETFTVEQYNETYDRWYDISFYPIRQGYTIIGTACCSCDVTGRKNIALRLLQTKRLYAFTSKLNQAIIHADNEQALFNETCRIAVTIGNFELACINKLDEQDKTINLLAQNNAPPADVELFSKITYSENGPIASILDSGKFYVVNDYSAAPEQSFWRQYAFSRQFQSAISLPIKKSGKITCILSLFSGKANNFDTNEIMLLEEVTANISFALDVFEKEKNRIITEQFLKHEKNRLAQAQAVAHLGNWELDFATGIAVWSEEACRIYGLSPGDNIQSYEAWISFIHPDDMDNVMKVIKHGQATLTNTSMYHRIIRRDGTVRHLHSITYYELDSAGKPTDLYSVAHDITDEKINITKLQAQNEQLHEIAWIQSHKVRGPLATILGLAQLFKAGYSTNTAEIIHGILATSEKLDKVIHEIVDKTHVTEIPEDPSSYAA